MKKRKQNTLRVVLTLAHKFEKRNIDLFVPFKNRKKTAEQRWTVLTIRSRLVEIHIFTGVFETNNPVAMKIIIIIHKHNDDVSNYKLYALGYRPTIALARNEEIIAKKKFIYVQCTTYINSEIY